jgi:DNA invertase Pin-like site-specific DNA recombinase
VTLNQRHQRFLAAVRRIDIDDEEARRAAGDEPDKAMFQMMGVFAEFERAMIVERVRSGIARKRAEQGGRWGRGRLSGEKEAAVRAELAKGTGVQKTRRLLSVGAGAVQRIKRDMAAAAAG